MDKAPIETRGLAVSEGASDQNASHEAPSKRAGGCYEKFWCETARRARQRPDVRSGDVPATESLPDSRGPVRCRARHDSSHCPGWCPALLPAGRKPLRGLALRGRRPEPHPGPQRLLPDSPASRTRRTLQGDRPDPSTQRDPPVHLARLEGHGQHPWQRRPVPGDPARWQARALALLDVVSVPVDLDKDEALIQLGSMSASAHGRRACSHARFPGRT